MTISGQKISKTRKFDIVRGDRLLGNVELLENAHKGAIVVPIAEKFKLPLYEVHCTVRNLMWLSYCGVFSSFLCLITDAFPRHNYEFSVPNEVKPIVPDIVRASSSYLDELRKPSQDPEARPGLFEGDMAMTNEIFSYWRIGLRWDVFPNKLWNNRTVPYVISPLYSTADYVTIYKAIAYLNYMTCIKFVPWDEEAPDYLLIWPIKYPSGCWSFVGKFGGPQLLSLQPPNKDGPNCLGSAGRTIHELMHALGIFHEQSRADRDKFINIHAENVLPGFLSNFDKQSLENTTYSYEYDYSSIMHYGRYFFSKDRTKPTISATMGDGTLIGQRKAMSKIDCLKVNELYGCLDEASEARRWNNICTTFGV